MSSTDGIHSRSQPALREHSRILGLASADSARGPRRSPNCVGLTKIVATTVSARRFASSTSARCPACSAPIVGTSATCPFDAVRERARQFFTVTNDLHGSRASDNLAWGGVSMPPGEKIKHERSRISSSSPTKRAAPASRRPRSIPRSRSPHRATASARSTSTAASGR